MLKNASHNFRSPLENLDDDGYYYNGFDKKWEERYRRGDVTNQTGNGTSSSTKSY